MKQYKVFKHPSGTAEAVKQGWSWPAFFFSFVWAIVKKQWALGILVFFYVLVEDFFLGEVGVSEGLLILIRLIISLVFGAKGNSWREKNLISRGYQLSDAVYAANHIDALALSSSPEPRTPNPR